MENLNIQKYCYCYSAGNIQHLFHVFPKVLVKDFFFKDFLVCNKVTKCQTWSPATIAPKRWRRQHFRLSFRCSLSWKHSVKERKYAQIHKYVNQQLLYFLLSQLDHTDNHNALLVPKSLQHFRLYI